MWKIALGVGVGFVAGLFVAKLKYESDVRAGVDSTVGRIPVVGKYAAPIVDKLVGVG
jgi:hypothetical protein